ncbi:YcaO-like family protein [Streptomyces formicae]|uniref:Streptolysin S biosynthesis protein D (SagD) n=1 Tax=Streptomyces formicae TaxID=1616117 RepID=A0A291QBB9_9ACTN|nr:YcaO-like family protein [Streptomyces formicae]ATL29100.1 Streptolysin S biosynthesis protein D (SagD) [Streptomyces formicae]
MRLTLHQDEDTRVHRLRARMHGPLCGITTSMGFLTRYPGGPRLLVGTADMTGVHVRQDQPPPKAGSYHIGGYGIFPFESHIRSLAETLERYSGYAAALDGRFEIHHLSYAELAARGEPVLPRSAFRLFTDEQYAREGFPFDPFDADAPSGWLRVGSLTDGSRCWVPAQRFLLGYVRERDEPWTLPAVTTGTATHTTPQAALRAALEEVVQVDAAMGHWYGRTESVLIRPDARTRHLDAIVDTYFPASAPRPEFHALPSPDLPGFTIACLLRQPPGLVPEVAIGLGSGASLARAMYRALLEAAGVQWLAAWVAVEQAVQGTPADEDIYDLEGNVGLYATSQGARTVERRFARHTERAASELPPDDDRPVKEAVRTLVDAFAHSGKQLYFGDLTTRDLRALGFHAMRVWSPETVSLPLPSAVPAAHPRFADYGGFTDDVPHPYP